ncbi:hypothetical protein F5Y04DRAFT_274968 [Hypomontagnella monticulosa]|nr:hypothetical protein F5Y04DRAFT_274968 [Hypomontagnella monticulosa]
MPSAGSVRTYEEMSKETNGKDYAVCDQCRIKKIRCGREKPFCSNCTRLGHKCEWSGNGKKGNQTVLLSHTIEGLSKRLETLEAALAETQNTVKQLVSGTSTGVEILASLNSSHNWPTPEGSSPATDETPTFKRPLGHFIRGQNAEISERYFEPTSLESLLYNIRDGILEPFINNSSQSHSLRECTLQAQQKLDILVLSEETVGRNGALPTAPPISILKAMIEPYFTCINPYFPIWTKDSFMRITADLEEQDASDQDLGKVVCSNNLILMALAANSLQPPPNPSKPRRTKSTRNSSSIDLDLTKGFLANAKRAIEHADLLLAPRLVNVQALLSLCLVAQEHMSTGVFARLFSMTAQCAKSIGLHDWEWSIRGQTGAEDGRERQCVSYCLYILDKVACWTVGTSPCILATDVHIDTIPNAVENTLIGDLAAKARLAEIQEGIYFEIYARRAPGRTDSQVRQLTSRLSQKLQDWLLNSGIDIEDIDNISNPDSPSKIELFIAFTFTQLLYMWPFREHPDMMHQCTEVSRRCMKLLLRLWHPLAELGHLGVFPRIVASQPPLYLYEIFAYALREEEEREASLELFQAFTEMLQAITNLRDGDSYSGRLSEVSNILTDVITAIGTQHKRRKYQHTPSPSLTFPSSSTPPGHTRRISPYSPPSGAVYHSNNADRTPIRVHDSNQDITNLSASSFEALMSPADSRSCAGDELTAIMGSLERDPFESFDILGYNGSQVSRGESLIDKEAWWD